MASLPDTATHSTPGEGKIGEAEDSLPHPITDLSSLRAALICAVWLYSPRDYIHILGIIRVQCALTIPSPYTRDCGEGGVGNRYTGSMHARDSSVLRKTPAGDLWVVSPPKHHKGSRT